MEEDFSHLDIEINKPLQEMEVAIRQKYNLPKNNQVADIESKPLEVDFGSLYSKGTENKIKAYSEVAFNDVYALVGGKPVARYDNFLVGTDNNERLAQQQDTWEKVQNGLTKAGANFLTTVVGNTAGVVIGIGELASGGNFYDNNFSNALADWNEKLRYQLPNYYTKQEQSEGFIDSLNNANFWANDFAGGLSFTLGTIVSEAIWATATGGTSLAARGALATTRAGGSWTKAILGTGKTAEAVAKYKNFVQGGINKLFTANATNVLDAGTNTAKWIERANFVRFIGTTSANEAGIEALHYKREQTENFERNFIDINGREPSAQEFAEFRENLNDSANMVFATNMAILAPSNLAMFGTVFGIKSPLKGLTKGLNKTLFGTGVTKKVTNEAGETIFEAVAATGKQKAARVIFAGTKGLAIEGLWEEGLQGATTKAAEHWVTSTFDPKYNNQTMSKMDAVWKGMYEQYTTKEGWKEIGIGMMIGSGMSLATGKGKFQELRDFERQDAFTRDVEVKGLNIFGEMGTPLAANSIQMKAMLDARVQSAVERREQAIKEGDDVRATLASQDILLSELAYRSVMGENLQDLVSKYSASLDTLSEKEYNDLGITDIKAYKDAVKQGYKSLVDEYEVASDFANVVLGTTDIIGSDYNKEKQLLKDAFTYSLVKGNQANILADNILKDMSDIIGEENTRAVGITKELLRLGKNKQTQVRKVNSEVKKFETERENLSAYLLKLQQSELPQGQKLAETQRKLVEVENKISKLTQDRENIAQEVAQERARNKGINKNNPNTANLQDDFISGEDLSKIDERLSNIDKLVKEYEGSNPQVYYELMDMMSQYKSAMSSFLDYNKSVSDIMEGKFKPKYKVTGNFFQKGKDIDEFTKEYLDRIVKNYQEFQVNSYANAKLGDLETISEEEWNDENKQDAIKNYIAERVKKREKLTPKEQEYYNNNQFEINELTRPNPNKPNFGKNRDTVTQFAEAMVNNTLTAEGREAYVKSPQEFKDLVQKTINFNMRNKEAVKRANELQKKLNELENSQDRKNLSKIKQEIEKIQEELNELYKDVDIEQNIPTHNYELLKIEKKELEDELATLQDTTETNPRVKEIEDRLQELKQNAIGRTTETINYTIVEDKNLGSTILKDGDYIYDENGQVEWFKTKKDAQDKLKELQSKPITQPEIVLDIEAAEKRIKIENEIKELEKEKQELEKKSLKNRKTDTLQEGDVFNYEFSDSERNGRQEVIKIDAKGNLVIRDSKGKEYTGDKEYVIMSEIKRSDTSTYSAIEVPLINDINNKISQKQAELKALEQQQENKVEQPTSTTQQEEVELQQTIDPKIQEEIDQLTEELNNIERTTTTENPRKKELEKQIKDLDKKIRQEATEDYRVQIDRAFEEDFILLKQDVDEMIKGIPTKEEQELYKAYKSGEKIKRTEKTETQQYPQGDIQGTPYSIKGDKAYYNNEEIPNHKKKDLKILLQEHIIPSIENKPEGKTLMTFKIEKYAIPKLKNSPFFKSIFTREEIDSIVAGENTMYVNDNATDLIEEKLEGVIVYSNAQVNPFLNQISAIEQETVTNYKQTEEDVNITEEEFKELDARMKKWYMAQSLPVGDVTMADLLTLIVQTDTQSQQGDTLIDFIPEMLFTQAEDSRVIFRPDITQTISGDAFVVIDKKNGDLHFSHLKAKVIAERLGGQSYIGYTEYDKNGKLVKDIPREPATKFLWDELGDKENTYVEVGGIFLRVGKRGIVTITKSDYDKVKEQLNIIYMDSKTGSWNYFDLYERNADGTTSKIKSTFDTTADKSDLIYETKVGDVLNFFVDMQTDWNIILKNKALAETEKDGFQGLSQGMKEEIRRTLEITSRHNGNKLTTLKADGEQKKGNENELDSFRFLRQRYAEEFISLFNIGIALADLPKKLDLDVQIDIADYYLGTPLLQLDLNNQAQELPITDEGLTKVITQGYVEGDNIVLADKKEKVEDISRLYIKNLVDENNTTKIPVVLLQKGKHKFLFPISMVKTSQDMTSKVEMIVANDTLQPAEKITALNDVLIEANSPLRLSLNDNNIDKVLEEVAKAFTITSAKELAETTFDKNRLKTEATIKIDLAQGLISSPKLIIDLTSMTIGKKQDAEKTAIGIRAEIVKDLAEIEKRITNTTGLNDTKLIQAFDNRTIENQPDRDIMNRRDINFLNDIMFDEKGNKKQVIQGKAVDFIGKKEILALRDKLEILKIYEKQVKTFKDRETKAKISCT